MSEELKGCPFCGAIPMHIDDGLYVKCINPACLFYPSVRIDTWQTRAPVEIPQATRERLEKISDKMNDGTTSTEVWMFGAVRVEATEQTLRECGYTI